MKREITHGKSDQEVLSGPVLITPTVLHMFSRPHTQRHIFNMSALWEITTPIDLAIMRECVRLVMLHHDGLRTRFVETESGCYSFIAEPDDDIPFETRDLSHIDRSLQTQVIEEEVRRYQGTLDLAHGPLLRIVHFSLGYEQPCRVLFIFHHFVCDGFSWGIVTDDLLSLYRRLVQGKKAQLPPKTTSVQRYVEFLTAYAQTEVIQQELAYWTDPQRMQASPLPLDYPEMFGSPSSLFFWNLEWSPEETAILVAATRSDFSVLDILLAAFFQVYKKWTGKSQMLVELSNYGRQTRFEGIDLLRTVGWITNVVPFFFRGDGLSSPHESMVAARDQIGRIPQYGLGFGLLRYLAHPDVQQQLAVQPVPEILFNYLGKHPQNNDPTIRIAKERVENMLGDGMIDPIQISVTMFIDGDHLVAEWAYEKNLYTEATMRRVSDDFVKAVQAFIAVL